MNVATAKDWPADKVERWSIDKLVPAARNARTHTDAQVQQIAAAIREWGWTNPILVDERGEIIAGHGRVLAARVLALPDVPVMVAKGWTASQKRAYLLADNKLALNAGWDEALLALELGDLRDEGVDLALIGFTDDEFQGLLTHPPEDFPSFGEDVETEHECPKCHYRWSGRSSPAEADEPKDAAA
jgi:hypothetical protein